MKHLRHFNHSMEERGGQALKRVEALDLPLAKWTGPIIQISKYRFDVCNYNNPNLKLLHISEWKMDKDLCNS